MKSVVLYLLMESLLD